jgi:hypothetical protein
MEDFTHFVAQCQVRWHVWTDTLACFYPSEYITPSANVQVITLQRFQNLEDNNTSRFLAIIYITH